MKDVQLLAIPATDEEAERFVKQMELFSDAKRGVKFALSSLFAERLMKLIAAQDAARGAALGVIEEMERAQ